MLILTNQFRYQSDCKKKRLTTGITIPSLKPEARTPVLLLEDVHSLALQSSAVINY